MGLDLVVEGSPKPGFEEEWRRLLKRSFAGEELSEGDTARFQEISIPAYLKLDAPQVGRDDIANEWILKRRNPKTVEEGAKVLQEFDGYFVIRLVKCDGVPKYSNGGEYEGADETSFRGSFFNDCEGVLSNELLYDAWNHKMPEQAVEYGNALLSAADAAERGEKPVRRKSFLQGLGLRKQREPDMTFEEQLDVVRAAGRWYIFWGERGHAIRAWF
jgi:hypothetical protein